MGRRHRAGPPVRRRRETGSAGTDLGSRHRSIPKLLATKIHAACGGAGRFWRPCLTGDKVNDCTRFEQVETHAGRRDRAGTALHPARARHRRQGSQHPRHLPLPAPLRYRPPSWNTATSRNLAEAVDLRRPPAGLNELIYRHRNVVNAVSTASTPQRRPPLRQGQQLVPSRHRRRAAMPRQTGRHRAAQSKEDDGWTLRAS
jgi:hypothetical protein